MRANPDRHVVPANAGEEAQIAAAGQLDPVKTFAFKVDGRIVSPSQRTFSTESHAALYIQQIGIDRKQRLIIRGGHRAIEHRPEVVFLACRIRGQAPRQQHMRCIQFNPGVGCSTLGQANAACIQAQTLAGGQRHITGHTQQTIAEQRHVVETACLDLINTQLATTVNQRTGSLFGRAVQGVGHMHLAEDQLTDLQHPIRDGGFRVIRRFERDRQTAARPPRAARPGREGTVQVQAIVGAQGNAPAIARHPGFALTGDVQQRLSARGFQARTFAQYHEQIGRRGYPGFTVDLASDHDLAAIAHLPIGPATDIDRRRRAGRDIDQRLFTKPDGTAMTDGVHCLGHRRRDTQRAQRDLPAPGIQRAVDGQLPNAAQVD